MNTYAWLSDTHFNFVQEDVFSKLCAQIRASQAQGIWLTGDIAEAKDVEQHLRMLHTQTNLPIYFVLGNHDYYGSSITDVDQKITRLHEEHSQLHWLDEMQPLWLHKDHALIGVGGWGDARAGDFMGTPIRINDHRLIQELSQLPRADLQKKLWALGTKMAQRLHEKLLQVVEAKRIYVLTHVPPFVDACWHNGNVGDGNWTPDFVCVSVGEVLKAFAQKHRDISIQVLCGHGHSRGIAQITHNLTVHTAAAEYRKPCVEAYWRC